MELVHKMALVVVVVMAASAGQLYASRWMMPAPPIEGGARTSPPGARRACASRSLCCRSAGTTATSACSSTGMSGPAARLATLCESCPHLQVALEGLAGGLEAPHDQRRRPAHHHLLHQHRRARVHHRRLSTQAQRHREHQRHSTAGAYNTSSSALTCSRSSGLPSSSAWLWPLMAVHCSFTCSTWKGGSALTITLNEASGGHSVALSGWRVRQHAAGGACSPCGGRAVTCRLQGVGHDQSVTSQTRRTLQAQGTRHGAGRSRGCSGAAVSLRVCLCRSDLQLLHDRHDVEHHLHREQLVLRRPCAVHHAWQQQGNNTSTQP